MKVKVVTTFIDKYTKKLNEVGSTIDVTEERFEELKNAGNYVNVVKSTKKSEDK